MAKYKIKDGIAIIPKGTQKIEEFAFFYSKELTSVVIPDSVTEIGKEAFSCCSALTEIKVAEGNPKYDSRKNCNAIIETARNKLIVGCKSTNIPDSVTEIGEKAFYGCDSLTSVTIPDSVTNIGERAFHYCSGLTSAIIPDSVTEIGERAFEGCRSLTSVTIPNSVTEIGERAFSGCSSLKSVTIPDSVTKIGERAFDGCRGLTSVTIPNSVSKIDRGAFDGCSSLTLTTRWKIKLIRAFGFLNLFRRRK